MLSRSSIIDLYNFFFSTLYFYYQKIGERQIPGLYAICFLTIFESFNFISLVFLYMNVFKVSTQRIHNYYGYLTFFPILALNYLYFYVKKQKEIGIAEFGSIPLARRKRLRAYFIVYISVTLISFVILLNL